MKTLKAQTCTWLILSLSSDNATNVMFVLAKQDHVQVNTHMYNYTQIICNTFYDCYRTYACFASEHFLNMMANCNLITCFVFRSACSKPISSYVGLQLNVYPIYMCLYYSLNISTCALIAPDISYWSEAFTSRRFISFLQDVIFQSYLPRIPLVCSII